VRRERSPLVMARLAHVAIDGPAGSGKTTVAHALAQRLGILYLDTGAMYRAVTLVTLRAGADPRDEASVLTMLAEFPVRATVDAAATHGFRIWAGDEPLGDELNGNEVSRNVSLVAAHPGLRAALVERQRAIAAESPVVMAGRDIGTVVLPDAPLKIFLTASLAERVERRLTELAARGVAIDRDELSAELRERDRLDATRAVAPLRAAAGAIEIDSTGASVAAVVERGNALAARVTTSPEYSLRRAPGSRG
jgi:cytidylate kinase